MYYVRVILFCYVFLVYWYVMVNGECLLNCGDVIINNLFLFYCSCDLYLVFVCMNIFYLNELNIKKLFNFNNDINIKNMIFYNCLILF